MQGILWAVLQDSGLLTPIVPRYEVVQCHHITLQYGVRLDDWWRWVGTVFSAVAVAECWNDRIQALRVELPSTIPCINSHPHITVSHQANVKPQEANQMLASAHDAIQICVPVAVQIEFSIKSIS